MDIEPDQSANQLLASLPASEWQRMGPLLEAAFRVVERHMGVVSITDTQVLRAERF